MTSENQEKESPADEEFILLGEKELHGYNDEGIQPLEQEVLDSLRRWLDPTNYDSPGSELSKNQNYYTTHTGKWLPEAAEYKQLFSTPNTGLLWIQGIPGSGKSVTAARLVNELTQTGVPLCFFFFREIIQRNRTQRSMIIDWLSQLIQVYPPCATRLLRLSEHYSSSEEATTEILWKTFSDAAVTMRKIYIIVDALDEMDPKDTSQCLGNLSALAMRNPSGIKIIATSRQNPEIHNAFKGCQTLVSLELDRDKIDNDIAWYTTQRLEDAKDTLSLDQEAREKLVKDLVVGANGLFLYAKLTLDEMISPKGQISLSEDNLPRGISDMYSHLLEKHRIASGMSLNQQISVLQTVVFTTETLYLNMISSILNLQRHGEKGLDMPLLESAAIIRRICGPLLEIKDDVVHIVHHSFTEYLTNKNGVRGSSLGDFPVLRAVDAHKVLCDICITLLNFDRFRQPGKDLRPSTSGCCVRGHDRASLARLDKYPFLKYALYNWGYHARQGEVDDEKIFEKMTSHLETEGSVFTQLRGDGLEPYPIKFTPLHIAAQYGIKAYVLYLLKSGSDVDALDTEGQTPLMYAAQGGNLDILELLLEYGAQLDKVENRKWTPLHFAARHGHVGVVRRLLELKVAPNPDGVIKRKLGLGYPGPGQLRKARGPPPHYTPVRLAIQHGYSEVVAELLPHLKPEDAIIENSNMEKGKTILHYAASNDRDAIVLQILEAGLVDVNQQDKAGRTPLLRAIQEQGTLKTVKVLLQKGADPGLRNPLHECAKKASFSSWSHQKISDVLEIAAALVDAGVDINAKDEEGNTPMFCAAKASSPILQWLIESGADVNLRNANGETPMHGATGTKTFECLLLGGVDVNAQDKDGATVLHRIHRENYSWVQDLTLFMKYGADPYLEDKRGESAFHAACNASADKLDEVMKIPGIDINARDRRGRSLLHLISKEQWELCFYSASGTVNIPEGVDINIQDHNGNTLLHLTAHSKLFRTLLRAGANPHLKNRWGKLPFQTLLANPELSFDGYGPNTWDSNSLKETLAPFDINMTDLNGNNALHTVIGGCNHPMYRQGISGIIDVLFELGINAMAKNNEGKTALHLAAGHATKVQALLKHMDGRNCINEVDAQGRTPLCYAAGTGCKCMTGLSAQYLLGAGADIGIRDYDGRGPLHFAAQDAHSLALYILLRHLRQQSSSSPADINSQDLQGHTPLHVAARTGHYATVLCLIDAGARVDIQDELGMTPLHHAAAFTPPLQSANPPEIGELERTFNELNPPGPKYCGCGVEIYEPQCHRVRDVIRLLIQHGSNPGVVSNKGYLPVHIAAESGATPAIEALYEWAKATQPSKTTRDIVTWASGIGLPAPSSPGGPYPNNRYELIKLAEDISRRSTAADRISRFTGPKEALWMALVEADEGTVIHLLEMNDSGFDSGPEKPEDDRDPNNSIDTRTDFERRVVRYVIQQGWTSLFPVVAGWCGLDDHDILAVAEAREPNLEMLRVLLKHPQIRNPNFKPLEKSSSVRGVEGDRLIEAFGRSWLPWHTEAVEVVLEDGRANDCLRGSVENNTPPLLYTVLGWQNNPVGPATWVNQTLQLILGRDGVDCNMTLTRKTGSGGSVEEMETPLIVAARSRTLSATCLETLIKAGADVNMLSPIQASLASKNPESLKILLHSGSRLPDDHHKLMYTLFGMPCFASSQNPVDTEIFKVLLNAGLDVNCPSNLTLEEIDTDSNYYYSEVDDLESGADKLVRGNHTGFSPFFAKSPGAGLQPRYVEQHQIIHDIALYGSKPTIVETLFGCAVPDVDARDASGRTSLLVACLGCESNDYHTRHKTLLQAEDVAIRLLEAGASPLVVDHAGYSALDCYFATQKPSHAIYHWDLFERLLQCGAAKAPSRQRTLLLALRMGFKGCDTGQLSCTRPCPGDYLKALHILELLKHGFPAGPDVRDSKGNTSMHLFLPIYLTSKRTSIKNPKGKGPFDNEVCIPTSVRSSADFFDHDTDKILDKVFQELLNQGNSDTPHGKILLQTNNAGETPLYVAFRMTQEFAPGILAKIVEASGGPEAVKSTPPTKNGRTLLHAFGEHDMKGRSGRYDISPAWMSQYHTVEPTVRRAEACQYLMNIGIDGGYRDEEGLTAMELASMMGHNSLVDVVGMQ